MTAQKNLLKLLRKGENLDITSFDVELETIFRDLGNIYKQAYHGGDLNDVRCIRLLDNSKRIISTIKTMCEKRYSKTRVHL